MTEGPRDLIEESLRFAQHDRKNNLLLDTAFSRFFQ